MREFAIAYISVSLALSVPVWAVTGKLAQPTWVRCCLVLGGPIVLATALVRKWTTGEW